MSTVQKVKTIDKTTIDIQQAELLSDELKCSIRVNAPDNKTIGKAFKIETLPLTSEKTIYTVLQKDIKGSWIALETTLPSNESLTRQWRKKKKAAENTLYANIPTYIMLLMTILALIYFMYLTLSQKLIIFESKDIALIVMGFVLFLVIELLVFYYINIQTLDIISFQSYTFPRMETYTIFFETEIRTINAILYRGRFIDFDENTNAYIFGFNASEIQGSLRDEDGEFFIDKIRIEQTEIYRKENEIQELFIETEDLNQKTKTLRYSKNARSETKNELPLINGDKDAEDIQIDDLEAEHKILEKKYKDKKAKLVIEIADHESKIIALENLFDKKLALIIDGEIDNVKRKEIVNAEETISKYKNELARYKIKELGYTNAYIGMVDEFSELSELFNDRMDVSLAHDRQDTQNIYNEQLTNGNGLLKQESNSIDWNDLIKTLTPIVAVTIIFFGLIASVSKIINSLAKLDSWAIAATLFGFIFLIILLIIVISRLSNKGKQYSSASQNSLLVNK